MRLAPVAFTLLLAGCAGQVSWRDINDTSQRELARKQACIRGDDSACLAGEANNATLAYFCEQGIWQACERYVANIPAPSAEALTWYRRAFEKRFGISIAPTTSPKVWLTRMRGHCYARDGAKLCIDTAKGLRKLVAEHEAICFNPHQPCERPQLKSSDPRLKGLLMTLTRRACHFGDGQACYWAARALQRRASTGSKAPGQEIIKLLTSACRGNVAASCNVIDEVKCSRGNGPSCGRLWHHDLDDRTKARRTAILKRACSRKVLAACTTLAISNRQGAVMACKLGHRGSCLSLAERPAERHYAKPFCDKKNPDQARACSLLGDSGPARYLKKACNLGLPIACASILERSDVSLRERLAALRKYGKLTGSDPLKHQESDTEKLAYRLHFCNKGNRDRCFEAAVLLTIHSKHAADRNEGRRLLSGGCRAKHGRSCVLLGELHRLGFSGRRDLVDARAWHERGCQLGMTLSCERLKRVAQEEACYQKTATYRNCNKWIDTMMISDAALDLPFVSASDELAEATSRRAAFELVRKFCERGESAACSRLAIHLWGKDLEKALSWYLKARALGGKRDSDNDKLLVELKRCQAKVSASCYQLGKTALGWTTNPFLDRACKSGHLQACRDQAVLRMGSSEGKDQQRALQSLKGLCARRVADACFDVAEHYNNPEETAFTKRGPYLAKACRSGHAEACYQLADAYEEGSWGFKADMTEADRIRRKACGLESRKGCPGHQP